MKYLKKWIVGLTVVLILGVVIFFACFSGSDYALPFTADEVVSITVSNWWMECKVIEDTEGIQEMISKFDNMKIVSLFDPNKHELEEGNYGNTYRIQLLDGTQVEYHVVHLGVASAVFTDEYGIKYKVHNFNPTKIWNQLDYEVQKMERSAE